MSKEKKVLVSMLLGIIVWAILIEIGALIFARDILSFTIGILLGSITSIGLLFHMNYSVNITVLLPPHKAKGYAISRYIIRAIITMVVILISIKFEYINLIGVVFGLFGLKVSAYLSPIISKYIK